MAWGFRVTCQDCRHEWEGIEASWRIGPSFCMDPGNSQSLFCPRCYLRVYLPRVIARDTWRWWYETCLAEKQPISPFQRAIMTRIDVSLASAKRYVPTSLDIGSIECPKCKQPMENGSKDGDRLVCPQCGGRSEPLTEYHSHVSMAWDPSGFS
jgi:hypothetical protein